jgi:hypothetical protein
MDRITPIGAEAANHYCLSDEASYATGSILDVTRGR